MRVILLEELADFVGVFGVLGSGGDEGEEEGLEGGFA